MYIAITAGCDGKGKSPTLVVKVESKFQPFNDVNGTIEILSRIGIGQLSSWNLEGENQNKIDELQLF